MKTANPCRKNYRPEIDPYFTYIFKGQAGSKRRYGVKCIYFLISSAVNRYRP